ncbi:MULTISPECIES: hypothetical protein [unclassified Devosia]|uniref:hypothetical protein n=1 Tax=unclassified Devosia TaxID=196773 RepID=UPI000AA49751|nr:MULTISPECIES: hypothetical protein [unclassified Devosia]MBN9362872.1 hypothetical protein [Devosia sp.]
MKLARVLPALLLLGLAAQALAAPLPPEFRTLAIGETAASLPNEGYEAFACGSNGGPPLQHLTGWIDFAQCAPDARGLHEVYVEFGRRVGKLAERFHDQYGEELWLQRFGGTRLANFPVVLSLLFDDAGVVRGFRAVTDDRAHVEDRGRAYLFRLPVFQRYGARDWTCADLPRAPGETGVGEMFIKEVCTKDVEGRHIRVETHYFRKPGQTGLDIHGMFEPGQYESSTRWEAFDVTLDAAKAAP